MVENATLSIIECTFEAETLPLLFVRRLDLAEKLFAQINFRESLVIGIAVSKCDNLYYGSHWTTNRFHIHYLLCYQKGKLITHK